MGAAILQQGCTIQCPHGGQASVVPTNFRVKVDGAFALLPTDVFIIAGCAFTLPNGTPSPCLTVEWQAEAMRVKIGGTGPLLETSVGLCKAATQAVQGPATVSGVQTKVKAL
jgi:hypothetical protein